LRPYPHDTSGARQKTRIRISAIIATFNRAGLLLRAMQSLVDQALDASFYEIIVVDNASTDRTAEEVRAFGAKHPDCNIAFLREEHQGVSHARNSGCEYARGEFVAFIDDDAVAGRDWLRLALELFDRLEPRPLAMGGPILPIETLNREENESGWSVGPVQACSWEKTARYLEEGECFSGSNMIFSKAVVTACGGFDVTIGMKGGSLSVGEDTALIKKIRETIGEEAPFYFSPGLRVFHPFPAYQLRLPYRLKMALAAGQSECLKHAPLNLRGTVELIRNTLVRREAPSRSVSVRPKETDFFQYLLLRFASMAGFLLACLGVVLPLRHTKR
jgi:GT2 family glycosyltransferase